MNNNEIYIAIVIMALVNYTTRLFPFLFFRKKELPPFLVYIEKYFPAVIMTILVLYTLKDISFVTVPYGFKEISGIIFTGFLHIYLKNYLVSIFVGTLFYMILIQYF